MNRFQSSSRRSLVLAAVALTAVAVWAAIARQPRPGDNSGSSAGTGRAGMIAAIDPQTGQLVAPTAEQAAALQLKALDPAEAMQGLEEVHFADGTVSVKDLSGRFMQYEVVRLGPDGSVQASCVQGAGEAAAALRDTVPRVVNTLEVK
jgi:hypothetical protein